MSMEELRALRRLWPNREHESNWLKALLCAMGLHRWHTLTLGNPGEESRFDFCRYCPEVRRHVAKIASLTAVLLLTTLHAPAHHAFAAEYDENNLVTVSGTVTGFTWSNPHAWLYVDVKDESARVIRWSFEMGSPNGLLHRGWKRAELKKGDQITIDGFGAKDGSNVANARMVTLPDGRKLFGGFQSTPGTPSKAKAPAR